MIVSKQEMQRLLDIEQEYSEALIKIKEVTKRNEEGKNLLIQKQQEITTLSQRVTFFKNEIQKYNEITVEVEEYVRERENEITNLKNEVTGYEKRIEYINSEKEKLTDIINKNKLTKNIVVIRCKFIYFIFHIICKINIYIL